VASVIQASYLDFTKTRVFYTGLGANELVNQIAAQAVEFSEAGILWHQLYTYIAIG
jgi:hypothetical protein